MEFPSISSGDFSTTMPFLERLHQMKRKVEIYRSNFTSLIGVVSYLDPPAIIHKEIVPELVFSLFF